MNGIETLQMYRAVFIRWTMRRKKLANFLTLHPFKNADNAPCVTAAQQS